MKYFLHTLIGILAGIALMLVVSSLYVGIAHGWGEEWKDFITQANVIILCTIQGTLLGIVYMADFIVRNKP